MQEKWSGWQYAKKCGALMRPFRGTIAFIFALTAVEETGVLVFPYFTKVILDLINDPEWRDLDFLIGISAAFLAVSLMYSLVSASSGVLTGKFRSAVDRHCIERVLAVQLQLSMNYHARVGTGEKLTIIKSGVSAVTESVSVAFFNAVPQFVRALCILMFLGFYDLRMVGVICLPIFILTLLIRRRDKIIRPIKERIHDLNKVQTTHMTDVLGNIRSVQVFGQVEEEQRRMQETKERLLTEQTREWTEQFREYPVRVNIRRLTYIVCFFYGFYLVKSDLATIGTVFMIMNLSMSLSDVFGMITTNWTKLSDFRAEAEDFLRMLELRSEIRDPEEPLPLDEVRGAVTFENVSFSYPNRKSVVRNLNFTVAAGRTVALVGKTGAGKSTVTMLLARGYDVDCGRVLVDGKDVRSVRREDLWARMGIVPQESELFQRRVRDNVNYGKPTASDEEIVEAAKRARAHEFIMRLPNGYDSVIGERGVNLSGGERQRIAIARAILKNPMILILDEATSQVDSETESEVKEAIESARKGRTTIIIAHRLSTVQNADEIIVLHEGEIVERGTHRELLKARGHYAALYSEAQQDETYIQ